MRNEKKREKRRYCHYCSEEIIGTHEMKRIQWHYYRWRVTMVLKRVKMDAGYFNTTFYFHPNCYQKWSDKNTLNQMTC